MRNELDLSLYLVTDRNLTLGRSLEEVVAKAVEGKPRNQPQQKSHRFVKMQNLKKCFKKWTFAMVIR